MALTFKQMQNEILGRIHGSHLSAGVDRIRVKQWLNVARDRFVGYGPWHFLAATATANLVQDQREYSLDGAVQQVNEKQVILTTTRKELEFLDDEKFRWVVTDPTATGDAPDYFTLVGYQKIQLFPIPNATAVSAETSITYEYYKRLTTAMSADGDYTTLPEYVDPMVLDLAESLAQEFAQNRGAAGEAYNRFRDALVPLWMNNSDILRLSPRDFPTPLKVESYEQATRADRS